MQGICVTFQTMNLEMIQMLKNLSFFHTAVISLVNTNQLFFLMLCQQAFLQRIKQTPENLQCLTPEQVKVNPVNA